MHDLTKRIFQGGGILMSLLVAPLLVGGAVVFYYKTAAIYSGYAQGIPWHGRLWVQGLMLGVAVVILTAMVFYFRKKQPRLGNQVLTLYILLPFIAWIIFKGWLTTALLLGLLGAALALTQYPVFAALVLPQGAGDDLRTSASGWGGMQALLLAGLVGAGLVLCDTARDWAAAEAKLREISAKGLYGEFSDLRILREKPHLEYAGLRVRGLRYTNERGKRISSGDDAYMVFYAQVSDENPASADLFTWPLWMDCESDHCQRSGSFVVAIDRCDDANGCAADFRRFLDAVAAEQRAGRTIHPPGLRLMTVDAELSRSEGEWRTMVRLRIWVLAVLQLMYTLFHIRLFFLLRRVI